MIGRSIRFNVSPLLHAAPRTIARPGPATADHRTIWSGELELSAPVLPSEPPRTLDGSTFDAARLLVRVAGEPVGFCEVQTRDGALGLSEVLSQVHAKLRDEVDRELIGHGRPPWTEPRTLERELPTTPLWQSEGSELVSIVVCTRNRPEGVVRCVETLRALRYRDTEILIVDNAPDDDATEDVVRRLARADPRIRYVREARPGLSCARNRALREATGDIVAFTDDDVRVDALWLDGLLRGFGRDQGVACVTGLVASSSLEHPAEQYFDGRVSWSSDCRHSLHVLQPDRSGSPMHPYASGRFGTGANIAVRRSALETIGEFDECLGAGSPTAGGEDLDMFVRVLRAGYALSYEPAALVWHDHRVSEASLRRQMHGYGKGLAAYLTKYVGSRRTGPDVVKRLPLGIAHALLLARRSSRTGKSAGVASDLLKAELAGFAAGPGAYLRARRAQDPAHVRRVASR